MTSVDIRKLTDGRVLLFDGAMGTMLQQNGLPAGGLPELYNLSHPQVVSAIHRAYVEAGADVISANTFQASALKLPKDVSVERIVEAGVGLARAAGARFVALDMGPLGQLMRPLGPLRFDEAYAHFRRQAVAGEAAGADCALLETFSDLMEIKAAVLAIRENTRLPILTTLTYQEDLRTFLGVDPITATLTLQGLGVDALGVNCSLGPRELMPAVEQILKYAKVPVLVQANAGLPEIEDGQTIYRIGAEAFCDAVCQMVDMGVRIAGGCCGTTPAFIALLARRLKGKKPRPIAPRLVTAATSGLGHVILDDDIAVIGERINPTGKKRLQAALREGGMDYIVNEAIAQTEAGSDVLDINVGLPDIDEAAMMVRVIEEVQSVVALPLQIDSADARAIEAGARVYNGKPIINSVNGKKESMDAIFPIAKKYGAAIVCLTLDESGIPETAEGRYRIAQKLLDNALAHGIPREDVLIDCLVLTASAQQAQVRETLRAIELVRRGLGLKTVLGVSNVSFGLPAREILNATFLAAAFGAGLSAPILNPLSAAYMRTVDAYRVLAGYDRDAVNFVARHGKEPSAPAQQRPSGQDDISRMIVQGRREDAAAKVGAMLADGADPLDLIDRHFIPALNAVGEQFEKKTLFLPQLMQSAEAVKGGFSVIKGYAAHTGGAHRSKGDIVLATVEGDIHDIGKNIVKMMLENYGYRVIDLGKDVPIDEVVRAVRDESAPLVGLSALMTTTVKSMKDTISAVKQAGLACKFMVGGAVLNEEYRRFVGADYYARDAMESVNIANRFFGNA
jgi:5-methyltetrahydrofolate--homocysteine methyltransferase